MATYTCVHGGFSSLSRMKRAAVAAAVLAQPPHWKLRGIKGALDPHLDGLRLQRVLCKGRERILLGRRRDPHRKPEPPRSCCVYTHGQD